MKIEVGEYIRTKQGTIGQIIEKYEKYCVIANRRGEIDVLYENIAKHSKNIIDLVEVGDYVNGARVVSEKYHYNNINFINVDSEISYGWGEGAIMENEIESIVTKEQFSNMEYRL